MQYSSEPSVELCRSDDEGKLLRPVEDKEQNGKTGETGENGDMEPKVADWRFGPAQLWYDMLEVPETGDGFNYGFTTIEKVRLTFFVSCLINLFIYNLFIRYTSPFTF